MLPKDFGIPWKTVYNWHEKFARLGTCERVQRALAERVRVGDGRDPAPSLFSIDSPTVKSAETVPDAGFDGGKRVPGRKRHVLVDTLGLVSAVAVTSAAVSDAAGAEAVLRAFDLNAAGGPAEVLGFMAYDPAFTGGVSVGSDFLTGDVTGDGVPDIVTGAGAAHPARRSASHSYTS